MGVACVRSCQKLPQCPRELMPAGSKTDVMLALSEPVRDSSSTSAVTELRKQRKSWKNSK